MVDLSWFRRRHQAQLRPYDKPARERHILSIICSCLSFLLLVLSLSLREWGKADAGRCKFSFKLTEVVLQDDYGADYSYSMSEYYTTSQQVLISCIISVSTLSLLSLIVATLISSGYPREKLEALRHYAVFNIVALLCMVMVAGLWLGVAQYLPTAKRLDQCGKKRSEVESQFSYAYYLLLVSGFFCLGAATFNLLFARSAADRRRSVRSRLRRESQRHRLNRPLSRQLLSNPPAYSLLDSTDYSETETETSLSEPEPDSAPPPPYCP